MKARDDELLSTSARLAGWSSRTNQKWGKQDRQYFSTLAQHSRLRNSQSQTRTNGHRHLERPAASRSAQSVGRSPEASSKLSPDYAALFSTRLDLDPTRTCFFLFPHIFCSVPLYYGLTMHYCICTGHVCFACISCLSHFVVFVLFLAILPFSFSQQSTRVCFPLWPFKPKLYAVFASIIPGYSPLGASRWSPDVTWHAPLLEQTLQTPTIHFLYYCVYFA